MHQSEAAVSNCEEEHFSKSVLNQESIQVENNVTEMPPATSMMGKARREPFLNDRALMEREK
jgi:hypothetical protein